MAERLEKAKTRGGTLIKAVMERNRSEVFAVIKAGTDVNITDNEGKTALMHAVQNEMKSIVALLIDFGADVNITDKEGRTALMYSCMRVFYFGESLTSSLMKAGADINITDNDGKTALMYSVQNGKVNEVVELIDFGADVNIADNEGKTALIYCAHYSNKSKHVPFNYFKSEVSALLKAGADINITDNQGKTALMYAVQNNKVNEVVELIDFGADVNIADIQGKTALMYCACYTNTGEKYRKHRYLFYRYSVDDINSVTSALLKAGADINKIDNSGKTALIYSLQNDNGAISLALIDAGADISVIDSEGKTKLLFHAASYGDENVISELVKTGTDLNKIDNLGKTALMYAAQNNRPRTMEQLIDAGAKFNITDNLGKSALMYAAHYHGRVATVKLIEAGADVNITDNGGKTALFYGVIDEDVVQTLVEEGNAVIDQRDKYGRSPLFYAFTKSSRSAHYLIEKGANLQLKDNCNSSILSFFVEHYIENELIDEIDMSHNFKVFKEHGVKQKMIFEALINSILCKTSLLLLNPSSLSPFELEYVLNLSKNHVHLLAFKKKKIINKNVKIMRKIFYFEKDIALPKLLELHCKLGADPNYADLHGNTALHYAACLPLVGVSQDAVMKICHQLEGLGVSFNAKNHQNETPLLYCLSQKERVRASQHSSEVKLLVKVCRFLLEHGSSVEDAAESGKSVFHFLLELFQQGLYLKENATRKIVLSELLELLQLFSSSKVTYGVTVNRRDANLNSPLHVWASLEFDWTMENDITSTVDHNSFEKELLETIFRHLLDCGAKLNDQNNKEETPLHHCRTWTAVKLLIDAGARPNVMDSARSTPLLVASKNITPKDLERFYPDVVQEQKSFWKAAIESNLDPWAVDDCGDSVLSVLIKSEVFVLTNALIELACEERYIQSDMLAVSLLSAICRDRSTRTHWKSIFVEKILKSRKVPIRYENNKNLPLHLCCRNITSLPEELLFEEGISPNTLDGTFVDGKKTSVHWTIAKHLLAYGADCNVLDESGQSCLDIARTCPVLTDLLTKPLNIDDMPLLIPWTSISVKYKHILAKVARRQECKEVGSFWYYLNNIQKGSFGLVFAGLNEKDGREVAIKRIEKLRIVRPGADKKEISNLTVLADCEQVVRYVSFIEDEHFAYIILELMEGNLDDYLSGTFVVENSISLCEDVVKGLKDLHEQNILHRDLKPSNILFKTYPKLCFKIADFGLSRRIDSTSTTVSGSIAGTRCWIAPEVLKSPSQKHSMASDVFSCGLVLHYVLSVKRHPFFPVDFLNKSELQISNETEANVMNNNPAGWDNRLCAEATDLLKCMLNSDDSKRPKAAEAIAHPLFWSEKKKMDLLIAVGNQPEFQCKRGKRTSPLTEVEKDLDKGFRSKVTHATWNDPAYTHMPFIYKEMETWRKYDTKSVVELVRFIRNSHEHVSDDKRPVLFRKLVLKDFVFLEYFPKLVMEVFNCVKTHGWDTREEIKYVLD